MAILFFLFFPLVYLFTHFSSQSQPLLPPHRPVLPYKPFPLLLILPSFSEKRKPHDEIHTKHKAEGIVGSETYCGHMADLLECIKQIGLFQEDLLAGRLHW